MKVQQRFLSRLGKGLFLSAVLWFLGQYVYENWHTVLEVGKPNLQWILLGSAFAIASLLSATWVFMSAFSAYGYHPSYAKVFGVQYVSRLGKYLPGKAWAALWGVWLYDREGIPKEIAASCIVLVSIVGILGALLVILLFGAWWVPVKGAVAGLVVCAVLLLASIHPRVFFPLINFALRLIKRSEITAAPVRFSLILRLVVQYSFIWVLYGIGFYCLVRSFTPIAGMESLQVISIFAFAQVAGLLVILAPAGIGVREGVLLLGLTPLIGEGQAIVLVAFCRIWQTGLEMTLAGVGWFFLKGRSNDLDKYAAGKPERA